MDDWCGLVNGSARILLKRHIGAPAPMAIEKLDGTVVFGSRRIAGVSDQIVTTQYLTTATVSNVAPQVSGLCSILSSIYALDMFLFNDDRHLGNYLSIDDNGVRRLYAFDFSRALFWHWPWNGFPQSGRNTRLYGTVLRSLHGFDELAAGEVLDRLGSLVPTTVEAFINRMPSGWLPAPTRSEFMTWWSDGARSARLDQLRNGIKDGTLL